MCISCVQMKLCKVKSFILIVNRLIMTNNSPDNTKYPIIILVMSRIYWRVLNISRMIVGCTIHCTLSG